MRSALTLWLAYDDREAADTELYSRAVVATRQAMGVGYDEG